MRWYDVTMASLAIGAPIRWTDNVLTQHQLPDIVSVNRGVTRLIPHSTLVRLCLIRELCSGLGIGVRGAVRFAADLLDGERTGVLRRGHLTIAVDRDSLERSLDAKLRDALESAPRPRRGRPRKS